MPLGSGHSFALFMKQQYSFAREVHLVVSVGTCKKDRGLSRDSLWVGSTTSLLEVPLASGCRVLGAQASSCLAKVSLLENTTLALSFSVS
jgi:hypothetical protein